MIYGANTVQTLFNTVSGKKIAFLGWAFKKETNDTRESAAIYVADKLIDEQADIMVYDPKVKAEQMYTDLDYLSTRGENENREKLTVSNNPYTACEDSHAVAILTEWDEFKEYDWQRIYDNMMKPAFVFDGRNILDKDLLTEIGFIYYSIGKP